jgi:hypothetical protein
LLVATAGRMAPTKLPKCGVPLVVMPVRKSAFFIQISFFIKNLRKKTGFNHKVPV